MGKINVGEMLKELLSSDEKDEYTVPVGKVSDRLVAMKKEYTKAEKRLKEDMDLRADQLALEMKRRMDEEFADRTDAMEENHGKFWDEIYKELNLDPDGTYRYDAKTRSVRAVDSGVPFEAKKSKGPIN